MTTAAKLIEEVRVIVAGSSIQAEDSASPKALRVGERAHQWLSDAAGWTSVHRGRLLPALYGLPIETVELDRGYRVVNGAGAVILFGEIDEP